MNLNRWISFGLKAQLCIENSMLALPCSVSPYVRSFTSLQELEGMFIHLKHPADVNWPIVFIPIVLYLLSWNGTCFSFLPTELVNTQLPTQLQDGAVGRPYSVSSLTIINPSSSTSSQSHGLFTSWSLTGLLTCAGVLYVQHISIQLYVSGTNCFLPEPSAHLLSGFSTYRLSIQIDYKTMSRCKRSLPPWGRFQILFPSQLP